MSSSGVHSVGKKTRELLAYALALDVTRHDVAGAEARRLMEIVHAPGTLELRVEAPTLRMLVEDTFKPLYRTKFRPGTWRRYEGLLRQGLLDELGDKRVDAIGAPVVRAFMATLAKRGIQARGPVNLLRALLGAAVETGTLQAMPELPKPPPPGRKLLGAPSTEEVEAMLGKAEGWLRIALALAANIEAVREVAGHSKLQARRRYVHATGADLRGAISQLSGS